MGARIVAEHFPEYACRFGERFEGVDRGTWIEPSSAESELPTVGANVDHSVERQVGEDGIVLC